SQRASRTLLMVLPSSIAATARNAALRSGLMATAAISITCASERLSLTPIAAFQAASTAASGSRVFRCSVRRRVRSRLSISEATRRSFNKDFLLTLAADFKKHGAAAIEKVRKQQPAAYMKICALLVPREMKLEHSGGVKAMTDEQIERSIELIKAMIAERDAANAKVIEGEAEVVPSLPAPGSGGTKMPKAKVSLSKSP